jgi:hypothetical protein
MAVAYCPFRWDTIWRDDTCRNDIRRIGTRERPHIQHSNQVRWQPGLEAVPAVVQLTSSGHADEYPLVGQRLLNGGGSPRLTSAKHGQWPERGAGLRLRAAALPPQLDVLGRVIRVIVRRRRPVGACASPNCPVRAGETSINWRTRPLRDDRLSACGLDPAYCRAEDQVGGLGLEPRTPRL